ncbi:hypothetical protein CPB86DRAFT_689096, partial [Serendipita vermifera]
QLLLGGIRRSEHDNKWYWELLPHIDHLPMEVKQAHVSYAEIFANVYRSTGRLNDSLSLWRYCSSECSKDFGERDDRAIRMKAELGRALWECGQSSEAEKMEREVLEVRKEILGPQHPS